MALGTDKILGPKGAAMVNDQGELTDACRDKFTADVASLMLYGNENGLGLQKTNLLYLVPTPPIPGPSLIIDALNPQPEPLFWFKPEPFALLALPILLDKEKDYQKLIVNTLYAPIVKMMNLNGKTSLGPIIDPTIVMDMGKFPDLKIPDLPEIMAKIFALVNLNNPAAKLKLFQEFGIGDPVALQLLELVTTIPDISPPGFSVPPLPIPPNPNIGVPSFVLPDLLLGLLLVPIELIKKLMTLVTIPNIDPLGLIKKILQLIIEAILKLLETLGLLLGLPKLLAATLTVIMKNLAGMLLCDVVGSLLGTGLIVKIVAQVAGLT